MVLFCLDIAEGQVEADGDLNILYQVNCYGLIKIVALILKYHFQRKQPLIIIVNGFLVGIDGFQSKTILGGPLPTLFFLLLTFIFNSAVFLCLSDTNIAILFHEIGNLDFVTDSLTWVVFYDGGLVVRSHGLDFFLGQLAATLVLVRVCLRFGRGVNLLDLFFTLRRGFLRIICMLL